MNTALTIGSTAHAPEVDRAAHGIARTVQAIRMRLNAWTARRPATREELAELHERRLEGARLRDELRRSVYLTHTF
jgi:hypothetical protein